MTPETNGNSTSSKSAGYYQHPQTGATVYLDTTPGLGAPLIDAYTQMGYVKVSEAEGKAAQATHASPVSDSSDVYTESEDKVGRMQYRKNGVLISKDEYENREQ